MSCLVLDVAWCVAGVETLALVDGTPGKAKAIPAVAMTLAVVAEMATARTRAWPRLLAATSPRESRLLGFMTSRMAGVVLANRNASSESALKAWSGTVRPMTATRVLRHRLRAGQVAEVVLDRPAALNALDTATLTTLTEFFTELSSDPDVLVVVLSGAGERAFCVGADLKERATMSNRQIMGQRPVFRAAFAALRALPRPSIAAVHGFALGGGCELALNCDVIVADGTAILGLPETSVGLVPGCGGTQLAARRIGPGRAAEMIFTGRQIGAAEAASIGLVDRLFETGYARDHALELAARIAANSPVAVKAAKQAIHGGAGLRLQAALDVEDVAWRNAASSADRKEGIAAFAEKRQPVWPSAPAGE